MQRPAAGANVAGIYKQAGVHGAGQARERVARNEMSGVSGASPVRTQKGTQFAKEATGGPFKAGGDMIRCRGSLQRLCNKRTRVGKDRGRA